MSKCQVDFDKVEPGGFIELVPGHVYMLKNRCGNGAQVLDFLKITDNVGEPGLFTQDVLKVLAARVAWQGQNHTSEFEVTRAKALEHLNEAIKLYAIFSDKRYLVGDPCVGHNESEFDHLK